MKSGEGAAKGEAVRKTVRFSAEAMKVIEAYRRGCEPIPSFSKAVNYLVESSASLVDAWKEEER